jgi:hypothetical protein
MLPMSQRPILPPAGDDAPTPLRLIPAAPPSLPALALALAAPQQAPFAAALLGNAIAPLRSLVTAWRVTPVQGESDPLHAEAHAAAHVVRHALDRMHRLKHAYGEWSDFDAGAYFDLTIPQAALLVEAVERLSAVHVTIRADLLLPSVARALRTWCAVAPVLEGVTPVPGDDLVRAHALMAADWARAAAAVAATRRLLAGEIDYMAANAADEERRLWLGGSAAAPAIALPSWLAGPNPAPVPTLTLAADFPLPMWKQPGRRRRLERARAARLERNRRARSSS